MIIDYPLTILPCVSKVYDLCTRPHVNGKEHLYRKLEEYFDDLCSNKIRSNMEDATPHDLLNRLNAGWQLQRRMSFWVMAVFRYLNSYGGAPERNSYRADILFQKAFRTNVLAPVATRVTTAMMGMIEEDRSNQAGVDLDLLRNTVNTLKEQFALPASQTPSFSIQNEIDATNILLRKLPYDMYFAEVFLQSTSNYFRAQSTVWLQETDIAGYLYLVDNTIARELDRFRLSISAQTRHELLDVCDRELLTEQKKAIFEALDDMMSQDRWDVVKLIYKNFSRNSAFLRATSEAFGKFIYEAGLRKIDNRQDAANPSLYVSHLLALQKKWQGVHKLCEEEKFMGREIEASFEKLLYKSIPSVPGSIPGKPAGASQVSGKHLLVRFCSRLLSKGGEKKAATGLDETGQGEEGMDLEKKMDSVIMLMRYVKRDLDVVEELYQDRLAKRMQLQHTVGIDTERIMLTKLKMAFGHALTHRMEGMLRDYELSTDIMKEYKETSKRDRFSATVLTNGWWPRQADPFASCNVPDDLSDARQSFLMFYKLRNGNRHLTWNNSMSQAVVSVKFGAVGYEFDCSMLQASVLLQFNQVPQLAIAQLCTTIGVEKEQMLVVMRDLTEKGCPLLRLDAKSGLYSVNQAFKHKKRRFRIDQSQAKETGEDIRKAEKAANEFRNHRVEAAIVRVMKTQQGKYLTHAELQAEVIKQLSTLTEWELKDEPRRLGAVIESLIERDYLERDENDRKRVRYLA